ncbi:UPF0280 family protein [Enterovirga rhinocerotis]|uniref:Uncharacterized protein n=1 Tax=Enterovirga rhinocerotis TaxID=1339210 RepID=A0A4R7C7W2_9HYPH|nr:hypothetical protein EV668_1698 [Enterovirga rhinocerotis]
MLPPQISLLPDGRRLHLQHGPIDLVVEVDGEEAAVRAAYDAAARLFPTILPTLCEELVTLRRCVAQPGGHLRGAVARRMQAAVMPFAADAFITPMAAVAGAVAEEVLRTMLAAAPLRRAFVNNGGDIALHLAPGEIARIGLVDRPDRPALFGSAVIDSASGIGGIATSGWRGRSFSRGIADAVTILARTAAEADAAATIVANAVDCPGHPAVTRVPAREVQADSDLEDILVTRDVGPLGPAEIAGALGRGRACAETLIRRGLIAAAALHLQGETTVVGERFEARPSQATAFDPSPAGEGESAPANRAGVYPQPDYPAPARSLASTRPPLQGGIGSATSTIGRAA